MKTITNNVVNFVESNLTVAPTVQEYFNGLLEGLTSQEVVVGAYYNTLSITGKELFTKIFDEVAEEVSVVAETIKTRSVKLRKQVSATAKRSRKKVVRATKGLFTEVNNFNVMEQKAAELCRRVGITPTSTPVLELMAITVEEAAFLFNTQELCQALQLVVKLAAKNLVA